ncbi:GlxA family transcriptional regulator [Protaetiibacter larvae]|uniref:Helix-turn-helix domain-containing protein n=1 Tax=Protaetiibacter larvae TaxID=2592654 RepID=A0A5C1Y519_9MICO|nr:DJ-1/PfpI family protein [Protaetiibacter larvae]QEO09133.1 helix-turn-helix domain-containing protein [Protaetiibacter larvae]
MRRHRVVVLVLDGAQPLDVGIPAQTFQSRDELPYDVLMCGVEPGIVRSGEGLSYAVEHGVEALATADTVIVPGYRDPVRPVDPRALEALRAAAARGARIAAICTGVFAVAAAGLLDGRRATTHWRHAPDLARLHPEVEVDGSVLFIDEGQLLTSAGVASGIDLCLHLIRRDHGVRMSNVAARRLVAAPYRSGGQSQYVPRSVPQELGDRFAATRAWAIEHLAEPLTVSELARHANVSARTFSRRFVEDTGYTPLQWMLRARVDLARELLERTELGVEQIAAEVGLGTGANLRLHFHRILGTSPSEYRHIFARVPA